ncbi:MAG: glycosyltransferase [Acidisphaera sp.]|nr:glycosyltransferase [Acidisphaera sp.]
MLNFAILLSNIIAGMTIDGEQAVASLCIPEGYDRTHMAGLSATVNVTDVRQIPLARTDARALPFPDDYGTDPYSPTHYTALTTVDGSLDIAIADVWILLTSILLHGPLFPEKPYLVYLPDLIQRLVPEIYGPDPLGPSWIMNAWQAMSLQRSQGVIVTTKRTGLDAVSYAGVSKSKVHVLPMVQAPLFKVPDSAEALSRQKRTQLRQFLGDGPAREDTSGGRLQKLRCENSLDPAQTPYFLWVTNSTQHKNHRRALRALELYYGQEDGRLACMMCGATTDDFKAASTVQTPYIQEVRTRIAESPLLRDRLHVAGELSHAGFRRLLTGAAYLWHNVLYDNGTFSVIEAASLGIPSLTSDYPQMREICEAYSINTRTFDPWSPEDTAAQLKAMEGFLLEDQAVATMSSREDLRESFSIQLTELLLHACSTLP